jgi:methylated-DNA-[protein]-cysteine S-methyltransferase
MADSAASCRVYQARLATPFAVLGVLTEGDYLVGIDFLGADVPALAPKDACAREVSRQLSAYLVDPNFRFELPLSVDGTLHQKAVWKIMQRIPRGATRSYGELAQQLKSSARAVGQACGANRVPIVIPCHRVVGKATLGGFMNAMNGNPLAIKRWLLAHERL